MADFVRVRDNDTGHHLSVPREAFEANPKAYSLLKQDATDPAGAPLAPTYKTVDKASSEKTSKEGAR